MARHAPRTTRLAVRPPSLRSPLNAPMASTVNARRMSVGGAAALAKSGCIGITRTPIQRSTELAAELASGFGGKPGTTTKADHAIADPQSRARYQTIASYARACCRNTGLTAVRRWRTTQDPRRFAASTRSGNELARITGRAILVAPLNALWLFYEAAAAITVTSTLEIDAHGSCPTSLTRRRAYRLRHFAGRFRRNCFRVESSLSEAAV